MPEWVKKAYLLPSISWRVETLHLHAKKPWIHTEHVIVAGTEPFLSLLPKMDRNTRLSDGTHLFLLIVTDETEASIWKAFLGDSIPRHVSQWFCELSASSWSVEGAIVELLSNSCFFLSLQEADLSEVWNRHCELVEEWAQSMKSYLIVFLWKSFLLFPHSRSSFILLKACHMTSPFHLPKIPGKIPILLNAEEVSGALFIPLSIFPSITCEKRSFINLTMIECLLCARHYMLGTDRPKMKRFHFFLYR